MIDDKTDSTAPTRSFVLRVQQGNHKGMDGIDTLWDLFKEGTAVGHTKPYPFAKRKKDLFEMTKMLGECAPRMAPDRAAHVPIPNLIDKILSTQATIRSLQDETPDSPQIPKLTMVVEGDFNRVIQQLEQLRASIAPLPFGFQREHRYTIHERISGYLPTLQNYMQACDDDMSGPNAGQLLALFPHLYAYRAKAETVLNLLVSSCDALEQQAAWLGDSDVPTEPNRKEIRKITKHLDGLWPEKPNDEVLALDNPDEEKKPKRWAGMTKQLEILLNKEDLNKEEAQSAIRELRYAASNEALKAIRNIARAYNADIDAMEAAGNPVEYALAIPSHVLEFAFKARWAQRAGKVAERLASNTPTLLNATIDPNPASRRGVEKSDSHEEAIAQPPPQGQLDL